MKYFVVNYKTYPQGSGANALDLTNKLTSVELPEDWQLVVCPQAADIYRIREQHPNLQIWAQHVDLIDAGQATGWTSIETLIMAGINGTLINHSEHMLSKEDAESTIQLAKEHQIVSCVAVSELLIAEKLIDTKPNIFAYEPPELVGGGVSLMQIDPTEAQEFVTGMKNSGIELCLGAGVSGAGDVSGAINIGYQGILVASAIVKADDPAQKLRELLNI